VIIPGRYCGPPASANGGITCGQLAGFVEAAVVEVTLRRPPPLDVELRVADGQLYDGEHLVASAVVGSVDIEPMPPVSLESAAAAEASYAGLVDHPFPGCFVCGTGRHDGLGLRPGRIATDVVAATWTPPAQDEFLVWGALDCPGAWADDVPGRPVVLGRMALSVLGPVVVGEPHVVMGWVMGHEGRKTFSGTALYSAGGQLLALAQQTWIVVNPGTF
jgi:hypothetical protein